MTERRLAAILAADVCGYSRLMGDDDEATLRTLEEYRGVFVSHVGAHGGRIIDTAGDSVLAEFTSAIGAVVSAAAIQTDLETRNLQLAGDRKMRFRIGVNVGDILGHPDGTIYGDGVNIAARVESLAPPGGVGISGSVYHQVLGKIDGVDFEYIGEHSVKNISHPVNIYVVRRSSDEERSSTPSDETPLGDLLTGELSPTILVADDNENNRFTLIRRLNKCGYQNIVSATNGREAIDLLESQPFDLVLLDIMMPEVNGYEVLEYVRADLHLREIPIVMISAIEEIDSVVKCLSLGAADYLPKPFNGAILRARVKACLERKRLKDEQASYLATLKKEKKRTERALRTLLPLQVVRELMEGKVSKPRVHHQVAVLSVRIAEMLSRSTESPPDQLLSELGPLIESFEQTMDAHDMVYKGESGYWVAAAGLEGSGDQVLRVVLCALKMLEASKALRPRWNVQLGIDFGTVCAGVVGIRRYAFDIWSGAAEIANHTMQHARPNAVTLTGSAWQHIADDFRGRSRGGIEVAGLGAVELVECTASSDNYH